MNGKPKSARAVRMAAWHCTHPDVDGIDKSLLAYLADYSNHGTAENAHPGNRNIIDALGLSDSPTDNRLKKNIDLGLIVRTARADGRSKASVYRICIESPHFPDQTPGGEWLIENPPCVDRAVSSKNNPPCVDRAVNSESALPEGANRPAPDPKPPCQDGETALPRQAATRSAPETHHLPTIHTRASSENQLARWKGWILLPTTTDLMGVPTPNEEKELKDLASKEPHGFEYLKKAVRKFRDRDQGFGGLTKVSPWRLFLQQSATAMAVAKQECLDSGDWRMEHDPVYRAQQEASIARQTAEHTKRWQESADMNTESIEDFLDEKPDGN